MIKINILVQCSVLLMNNIKYKQSLIWMLVKKNNNCEVEKSIWNLNRKRQTSWTSLTHTHTHTQYKVLVYLVLILKIDFTNRHNWKIQAITSWKKILPQAQSRNIKYRLRLKVSSLNIRSKFLKKGNHLNLKGWTSKKCLSHFILQKKKQKENPQETTIYIWIEENEAPWRLLHYFHYKI